jgi:hypothetical protein
MLLTNRPFQKRGLLLRNPFLRTSPSPALSINRMSPDEPGLNQLSIIMMDPATRKVIYS